jgi:maltose-binding protein MalE
VISRCTKHPHLAWKLAIALSSLEAQVEFAAANNLLPALEAAYRDPRVKHNHIVTAFRQALSQSQFRPQHQLIARIFDDFTPAIQAVILGDATPEEALSGVARSWQRLFRTSPP